MIYISSYGKIYIKRYNLQNINLSFILMNLQKLITLFQSVLILPQLF